MRFTRMLKNPIVGYALARYIVSAISFITSMIIAVRLGSYLLGIWGVFLLLRRYLQLINLGIPDSSTILLVQNKNNHEAIVKIESNAIAILIMISLFIFASGLYNYYIGIDYIIKYNLRGEYLALCLLAVFTLYGDLFCKIYRVEGRIGEITFYQSIIQILSFLVVFIYSGKELIDALICVYLIGTVASLVLFIARGQLHIRARINFKVIKTIINKGIFLFAYNLLFYLIFISTRILVSYYYEVREFGFFTFAYTLSNAIILLIDAVAALLIPKLIDRFHTDKKEIIEDTISKLRTNYMYASYVLMFVLLMGFTGLLFFLPDYFNTYDIVVLMSATIVLQSHSFPYTVYLMANNKERMIAYCSLAALIINVVLNMFCILNLHVTYQYVIIGTWISYMFFTYSCIYYSKKAMNVEISIKSILHDCLPLDLIIPLAVLFASGIMDIRWLLMVSVLLFVALNYRKIAEIAKTLLLIINRPQIINIKK